MAIYTQNGERKWLKTNNKWGERGVGIKMSWVGKILKINNRVGETIIRDSRVSEQFVKSAPI